MGKAGIHAHGRYDSGSKHTTIPTAAISGLQTAAGDPKLQNHLKLLAEAVSTMLTTPKLQELAREHMKAIMDDPGFLKQARLLAAQLNALATGPEVKELLNFVAETPEKVTENHFLQEHAKLASEHLSAIFYDARLSQQSKLFVEQLEAMMTDPKVENQDIQERVKVFSHQLQAMLETPELQKHSTFLAEHMKSILEHPEMQERAKLFSEELNMLTDDQDFVERVELASEQSKKILEHPLLQERLNLFAQQIKAMMTDSEVQEGAAAAAAAAEQLDAIMKYLTAKQYSEAIKAHVISQSIDGGPTLGFSSLAEVHRSSSVASFAPPVQSRRNNQRRKLRMPPWSRRHPSLAKTQPPRRRGSVLMKETFVDRLTGPKLFKTVKRTEGIHAVPLVPLRVLAGILMIHHGSEGGFWPANFGTPGFDGFVDFIVKPYFSSLPGEPALWAAIHDYVEFWGGILFAIGFLTRPAAGTLLVTMIGAVYFHLASSGLQGFPFGHVDNYSYNFEEPTLYALIFLLFFFNGPGPLSVDSIIYDQIKQEDD